MRNWEEHGAIALELNNVKAQRDELLEALEEVNEFIDYLKEYNVPNDFPTDLAEKINTVIAKAKGGSQ